MYNALTGRNEKVGNWAGVTVDKKEHPIKKAYASNAQLIAVDLPGAYSMSPLNVGATIGGLAAVIAMVGVVVGLILNTNKKLRAEYAFSSAQK